MLDGEGNFALYNEGQETVRGVLTVTDADGDSGRFVNEYTAGTPKGRKAFGIYRFVDDTLEVCTAWTEEGRPTAFTAAKGSRHALAVYRRGKSE